VAKPDEEAEMDPAARSANSGIIPKRRQRHHSYDESVDESSKLLENEPVAVESETPAEDNQPIERDEQDETSIPPAFEEE
jgi:hypothetical protein